MGIVEKKPSRTIACVQTIHASIINMRNLLRKQNRGRI